MNAVESDVEKLVQKELESASQKFPVFHSDYEGAAVIFEEIEESEKELKSIQNVFDELWYTVKSNESSEPWVSRIRTYSINLVCEAIQVAAMAQKFIDSQKEREKIEGN